MLVRGRPPEMHEAGVVEGCGRLEAGDVTSEFGGFLVGLEHDGEGVPADGRSDPVLDGPVTGMGLLPPDRNCVYVGGCCRVRDGSALAAGPVYHLFQEEVDSVGAIDLQNTIQRVEPFSGLDRVEVATAVHRHLPGASVRRGCADYLDAGTLITWI